MSKPALVGVPDHLDRCTVDSEHVAPWAEDAVFLRGVRWPVLLLESIWSGVLLLSQDGGQTFRAIPRRQVSKTYLTSSGLFEVSPGLIVIVAMDDRLSCTTIETARAIVDSTQVSGGHVAVLHTNGGSLFDARGDVLFTYELPFATAAPFTMSPEGDFVCVSGDNLLFVRRGQAAVRVELPDGFRPAYLACLDDSYVLASFQGEVVRFDKTAQAFEARFDLVTRLQALFTDGGAVLAVTLSGEALRLSLQGLTVTQRWALGHRAVVIQDQTESRRLLYVANKRTHVASLHEGYERSSSRLVANTLPAGPGAWLLCEEAGTVWRYRADEDEASRLDSYDGPSLVHPMACTRLFTDEALVTVTKATLTNGQLRWGRHELPAATFPMASYFDGCDVGFVICDDGSVVAFDGDSLETLATSGAPGAMVTVVDGRITWPTRGGFASLDGSLEEHFCIQTTPGERPIAVVDQGLLTLFGPGTVSLHVRGAPSPRLLGRARTTPTGRPALYLTPDGNFVILATHQVTSVVSCRGEAQMWTVPGALSGPASICVRDGEVRLLTTQGSLVTIWSLPGPEFEVDPFV